MYPRDTPTDCFNDLSGRVKLGCLAFLRELKILISTNHSYQNGTKWPSLTDLHIRSESAFKDNNEMFFTVEKLVKGNSFPSLQNIFVKRHYINHNSKMLLILERFQRGKKSDVISDWPDFGLRSLLKSASGSYAMKDLSDLFFRDQNEKAQMQGIPRTRHLFRKYNFCDSFTDPNNRSSTTSTRKTWSAACHDCAGHCVRFVHVPDGCKWSRDQLAYVLRFGGMNPIDINFSNN